MIIRIGKSTSQSTAKINDGAEPMPIGSAKEKSPETNFKSFGIP